MFNCREIPSLSHLFCSTKLLLLIATYLCGSIILFFPLVLLLKYVFNGINVHFGNFLWKWIMAVFGGLRRGWVGIGSSGTDLETLRELALNTFL